MLDRVIASGRAAPTDIDRIMARLIPFFLKARRGRAVRRSAGMEP